MKTKEVSHTSAERSLSLKGGYNFRDLGGYPSTGGRSVRPGQLFRGGAMNLLAKQDLLYLEGLPIITLIDFRTASEIARAQDKFPASMKNYFNLPISPGNLDPESFVMPETMEQAEALMHRVYREFALSAEVTATYRTFFTIIQKPDNLPTLYHCTAGKDRTGVASALILHALGVPPEIIMDDFMASNRLLENKYGHIIEKYPQAHPLFFQKPSYLEAYFSEIEQQYERIQYFLEDVLNIDVKKMRSIYLY